MTLTEQDRAAINRAIEALPHTDDLLDFQTRRRDAIFMVGKRAGRLAENERCAKVCEGPMSDYCEDGSSFAEAIRAAKDSE